MKYETHHLLPEPLVDLVLASGGDRAGVVAFIPYGGRPIIVRVSARLLDGHDYVQKTEVWPCLRRVFVPQVVKIEMSVEALEEFKKPILYPETFAPHLLGATSVVGCLSNITLYAGITNLSPHQVRNLISGHCQSFVPEGVNLRFASSLVTGRFKIVNIVMQTEIRINIRGAYGFTENNHISWLNQNPFGICYV